MPINIGGNHWIMVCINFEEGELIVWDSFQSMMSDFELAEQLKTMSTVIPALLFKCGVLSAKPSLPIIPWRVRREAYPSRWVMTAAVFFVSSFFSMM